MVVKLAVIFVAFSVVTAAKGVTTAQCQCDCGENRANQKSNGKNENESGPCKQGNPKFLENEFVIFGNSSYMFAILPLTWAQASAACRQMNAHLVVVDNYMEDLFLTSRIMEIGKKYPQIPGFYIDAQKIGSAWKWHSTNRVADYIRWGSSEPGGTGRCIVYWRNHPPFWNQGDIPCSYHSPFICERNSIPK